MKRFLHLILIFIFSGTAVFSQNTPRLIGAYSSPENPYYWKNKKPHFAYWQQDVHYTMQVRLDDKTNILSGSEDIIYVNNSPDTLHFVYFHLYQNAFQPGSYLDQLAASNKFDYPFGSIYQQQGLGIVVETVSSEGMALQTETDNTIMKVYLARPLVPGGSYALHLDFKTYFDMKAPWGRMRVYEWFGNKHFNGGHFYPRVAVYDYRSGWDTDQHLGHEFYGEFGTFAVSLDFPAHYILDGTGTMINEKEMLPDDLRQKLDISNFKDKAVDSEPSVIIPVDSSTRKIWKFEAMNVHDFAFVADPTFRIGEVDWNGVRCIALVSEPHAAGWQNAAQLTADIIALYSSQIGPYAYPKIIVCDARSGMEYPMLTMDGGSEPDYTHLMAHEIGHNWFFGMIGNNETYQAALDEGFTQFLTVCAMEEFSKTRKVYEPDPSPFFERNTRKDPIRYTVSYDSYLESALKTQGVTLNTHSDMFDTRQSYGNEYRQTYNKTAVMLFNLQYVLGEDLFQAALQDYFKRWSFCHPYLDDLRTSFNQFTGENLNWFFDEWLETNKTIDYSVRSVRKQKGKDVYKISLHRRGAMQMPLDINVYSRNDSIYSYYIPNQVFVKQTKAKILPRWTGWNRYNQNYDFTIEVPGGIRNVVIDSSRRLADINLYNNRKKRPIVADFDYCFEQPADWSRYEFYGRPDVWYNGYDGVKVGFHLDGGYMKFQHVFELAAWVNTRLFQQAIDDAMYPYGYNRFSFRMNYETPMRWLSPNTRIKFSARSLDGVNLFDLGLEQKSKSGNGLINIGLKSMFLFGERSLTYLMYPGEWSLRKEGGSINYNNIIYANIGQKYQKSRCLGSLNFQARTSAFGNDYNFATFAFTHKHRQKMWRFFLNTRFFIQYAVGRDLPDESSLFLAGASPEELLDNKFTRSMGFFPTSWTGYGTGTNHFHAGGGLNLRGYSGYLVAQENQNGEIIAVYKGNSGVAINAELDLDRLVPFRPRFTKEWLKWNIYLFGDAGIINYNSPDARLRLAELRADAGIGTAITIKKWGRFDKIKPFTLRFDMPLFLNRPPATENEYFKFRWVVGINRAF